MARPAHSHHLGPGIWLGAAAHILWGLTPIYWNLVDGVGALEIIAHRVAWSAPALIIVLAIGKRLRALGDTFRSWRAIGLAAAGAAMLSVNWGLFVWAVVNERILEASLGYFMTPLVSVVLGVVVLGEHLSVHQRTAVALATVGVGAMTVLHGGLPWVSLALAFSFGTYGLLKKTTHAVPALEGLLGEVAIVAVPAAAYILVTAGSGDAAFAGGGWTALWLVAAGLVTVAPLWLFGEAVQRIPLSTMGLLQYFAPSLQLVVGVALYGESLSTGRIVGFVSVWLALLIFVRDQLAAPSLPVDSDRHDEPPPTLPMSTDPRSV